MHHHYEDIRNKIAEQPSWFDENAYEPFAPHIGADIYADEIALVLIACQSCGREFRVAFSFGFKNRMEIAQTLFIQQIRAEFPQDQEVVEHLYKVAFEGAWKRTLADDIRSKSIHYGDPPNTGCCPAGPTMNCEPHRVLEYWRKEEGSSTRFQWVRDPSLEIDAMPEWVEESKHV